MKIESKFGSSGKITDCEIHATGWSGFLIMVSAIIGFISFVFMLLNFVRGVI